MTKEEWHTSNDLIQMLLFAEPKFTHRKIVFFKSFVAEYLANVTALVEADESGLILNTVKLARLWVDNKITTEFFKKDTELDILVGWPVFIGNYCSITDIVHFARANFSRNNIYFDNKLVRNYLKHIINPY